MTDIGILRANKPAWKGTAVPACNIVPLTDLADTYTVTVEASKYIDLVVDVKIDKGATIDILPVVSINNGSITSRPGTQCVIADGGTSDGVGIIYTKINAQFAIVTVNKTEAGDSTITQITVSGSSL